MSEAAPEGAIAAATLIVFRKGGRAPHSPPQLLMVERSARLRFAGGAAVFPGGRVDPGDEELAARLMPGRDPGWAAGHIAAMRETLEETGLLVGLAHNIGQAEAGAARRELADGASFGSILGRYGWTIEPEALVPFARWCPPEGTSRVFDTRFYIADLGTGAVDLAADGSESSALSWDSAQALLERGERGEITLVHPTMRNLERLRPFADFAEARRHAQEIPPRLLTPFLERRDEGLYIGLPPGFGYGVDIVPLDPI